MASLSSLDLALLLAGAEPGTPQATSLEAGLRHLDGLAQPARDAARAALVGLAQALWHQERALAGLSPSERSAVLDAQRSLPPGAQPSPEVAAALRHVDQAEVWQALAALRDAGGSAFDLLAPAPAAPSVGAAIASRLGLPAPAPATVPSATAADVLALLQAVSGADLQQGGRDATQGQLASLPPPVLGALRLLLEGLQPLSGGAPTASDAARLGADADAARPILQAYGALVAADAVWRIRHPALPALPDPEAKLPPTLFGKTPLVDGRLPLPPAPAAALRDLAQAIGDAATARSAATLAAPVASLPPGQRDAIAQVWSQAAQYVLAARSAAAVPAPEGIVALLDSWHAAKQSGTVPDPASPEGQKLLVALPFLQAQQGVETAQQDLLTAVAQLVPAFQRSAAATAPDACTLGQQDVVRVRGYLTLDPCQRDSQWVEDGKTHDQAMVLVDAGGNDQYTGRFGGAPFTFHPNLASAPDSVQAPISIVVDLGGSDQYDAGKQADGTLDTCAQGAACADRSTLSTEGFLVPVAPVGVLIDWDGDGAVAKNSFVAGAGSQGYAGDGATIQPADIALLVKDLRNEGQAYGLLVERVGDTSEIHSTYQAGGLSQGSAGNVVTPSNSGSHSASAALVRLVGSSSTSSATFTAGGGTSQGAQSATGDSVSTLGGGEEGIGSLAALVVAAGRGTVSTDAYNAVGKFAQGAGRGLGVALFADVAGPGSVAHTSYAALGQARGYAVSEASGNAVAVFLDAVAPGADPSTLLKVSGGVVQVGPSPAAEPPRDDTYSDLQGGASGGWGYGGGAFADLGGSDGYPDYSGNADDNRPRNDASWHQSPTSVCLLGQPIGSVLQGNCEFSNVLKEPSLPPVTLPEVRTGKVPSQVGGTDAETGDANADLLPDAVNVLWDGYLGLWPSSGPGHTPLPVPPGVLLDLDGTQLHLDDAYAFVLAAGAAEDDWYGPGFSSVVHLDLGGSDQYLGPVASASGILNAAGPGVGGADRPNHFLSFLLDLMGNDAYGGTDPAGAPSDAQGFGAGGAAGILLDLGGSDSYLASTTSQGFGSSIGLGVLVDLPLSPDDANLFQLASPPGQGAGAGGGIGLLVAGGAHNTFADGVQVAYADPPTAPAGPSLPGPVPSGASVNAGSNAAPSIDSWTVSWPDSGPVAGVAYTVAAKATDPEGDPLTFCWTFQASDTPEQVCAPTTRTGAAQVAFTWTHVATDASDPLRAQAVDGTVTLTVRDSGGLHVSSERTYLVSNPPPVPLGGMLGPSFRPVGQPAYFQLPYPAPSSPGEPLPTASVEWGDGSPAEAVTGTVDWALTDAGATSSVPDAYIDGQLRDLQGTVGHSGNPLDPPTECGPAPLPECPSIARTKGNGAMVLAVDLAGGRQLSQVQVVLEATLKPVSLSLDAVRPDGGLDHLRAFTLSPADRAKETTVALDGLPFYDRLVLSQVLSADEADNNQVLRIHGIHAYGPGFTHTWTSPGTYSVTAVLHNAFGGSSAAKALDVKVVGAGAPPPPVELLDIGAQSTAPPASQDGPFGGRGAVRFASLVTSQSYSLALHVSHPGSVRIDWGDGASQQYTSKGNGEAFLLSGPCTSGSCTLPTHTWAKAGDHPITVTVEGSDPLVLTTAVVEDGLDLRAVAAAPNGGPAAEVPILFLTQAAGRTWHEGIPFLAILDAGGPDRFAGRVAAPVALAGSPASVARPALVVDASGANDYVSTSPGTQGFGSLAAVALLVDGGDSAFVAPAFAQGAGTDGGLGALVHLVGEAHYEPVAASDPVVAAGYASAQDPWTERPASFTSPRPATLPDAAHDLQGAGRDGAGVLVELGSEASFNAGSRSQGFGDHGRASPRDYAVPSPSCADAAPADLAGGRSDAAAVDALCALGVGNVGDPSSYLPTDDPRGFNPQALPAQFPFNGPGWCKSPSFNGGSFPAPLDHAVPCQIPNLDRLNAFLASAPGYGPGVGLLLHGPGPAAYAGGSLVQGASAQAGRGVLADAQGAAAFTARERGQAYSAGGTAGAVALGPALFRLVDWGQAAYEGDPVAQGGAEGLEAGLAIKLGGTDESCVLANCHGLAPPALDLPFPDAQGLGVPAAPTVTLTPSASSATSGIVDLAVGIGFGPASSFELQVLGVTRAGDGAACSGPVAGPPTLLFHGIVAAASVVHLDLDQLGADGAPTVAAGCTELKAWARAVASPLATGWGASPVAVLHVTAPPRAFRMADPALRWQGAAVPLRIEVLDPLAATDHPGLHFRLERVGAPANTAAFDLPLSAVWDGATVTFPFDAPGSNTLLPEGTYRLLVSGAWGGASGPEREVSHQVFVSRAPAGVTAENVPATWKQDPPGTGHLGPTLSLHGTALLPTGLSAVFLRLADASGNEVPMQGVANCPAPAGGASCKVAALLGSGGGPSAVWTAALPSPATGLRGAVTIQASMQGPGGPADWTAWADVGQVLLDGFAPTLRALDTPHGNRASNGGDRFDVRVGVSDVDPACACGTGVQSLQVLLVQPGQPGSLPFVAPLEREPSLDAASSQGPLLGFSWSGGQPLPDGVYQVEVLARDVAGNLRALFPGAPFQADAVQPTLDSVTVQMPSFAPPGGPQVQSALKEGDAPVVVAAVRDAGGIASVAAHLAGTPGITVLTLDQGVPHDATSGTYRGAVPVHGLPGGSTSVAFEVDATDLAGNVRPLTSASIPFEGDPCPIQAFAAAARSDALGFSWSLARPGQQQLALVGPEGPVPLQVVADAPGGLAYHAKATDLPSSTSFIARLTTWTPAGCLTQQDLPASTLALPSGTLVRLDAFPAATRSGTIAVTGTVVHPLAGTLTLHLGAKDGPVLGQRAVAQSAADAPFRFDWDSAALQDAQDVVLVAVLDDGFNAFSGATSLRVDNQPPSVSLSVAGPAPNAGWYNGSILVQALTSDPTGPVQVLASADGAAPSLAAALAFDQDGPHQAAFRVSDAALPPNVVTKTLGVRIDRTLPSLDLALDPLLSSKPVIAVRAHGSDAASGVDAYRIRARGQDWSAWSAAPPTSLALGSAGGERWVDVQVRDVAGNVRQESRSVLLDHLGPQVLAASWAGWSADAPVLFVVSQDRLDGEGRPAGVDALRFQVAGTWGPWTPFTGEGAVPAPGCDTRCSVQVRDAAGNPSEEYGLSAPPAREVEAKAAAVAQEAPHAGLGRVAVQPADGDVSTPFAFTAVVYLPAGTAATVQVQVDGASLPMQPTGPRLTDGGQLYATTTQLTATRLDQPSSFHVVVTMGGAQVASAPQPAPLVSHLAAASSSDARGAAAPVAALLLPGLLALARRRRDAR